jgi:ribosome-associated translation inhibitor RaiA
MKITYSNIEADFRNAFDDEAARHIVKLNRLLKRYASDLVLLHASFDKTPRKTEFGCTLNLTLPTGTMHATGLGPDIRSSAKTAFADIEHQLKKHQEKLRKDYVWKRKRPRDIPQPSEATSAD